jgi:hypothetical protein
MSLIDNATNAISTIVEETISTKLSCFEKVIGCICVVIGIVYFGAMSAITLLAKHDADNKTQIKMLQLMMEHQQKKIETLEKKLTHQKKELQLTRHEVNKQNKTIECQSETITTLKYELRFAVEGFDFYCEDIYDKVDDLEMTLENNFNHLEKTSEEIMERLEENENQLYSVEDELFERVKEMGDRVEEVDRSVIAVEKSTENLESEFETLRKDSVQKVSTIEERMTKENENELILLGYVEWYLPNRIRKYTPKFSTRQLKELKVQDLQVLCVDQILKLNIETVDFLNPNTNLTSCVYLLNNASVSPECAELLYNGDTSKVTFKRIVSYNSSLQTLIQHFHKCGTKIMFNGENISEYLK